MKRKTLAVIVLVLVFALLMPTACKAPRFELTSLEVSPTKVATGDTVTATVELANVGSAEGLYSVTLSVDGVILETKELMIPAETTRKVQFSIVKEEVGVYTAEVGGLTATLEVVKPAEFQVSSLEMTPEEVMVNKEVIITAEVSNISDVEGSYSVTFKVDGRTKGTRTVKVAGRESEAVSFTVTANTPGVHNVSLNTLSGSFKVAPAPPAGYEGYTDWQNGFFIAYPVGWEQTVIEGSVIGFDGPMDREGFTPNFGVGIETGYYVSTVQEYVEGVEEMYGSMSFLTGYTPVSTEEITINGIPAGKHILTWTLSMFGETFPLKQMQVYLVKDQIGFYITLTATPATFDTLTDTFDIIISSFQFLP